MTPILMTIMEILSSSSTRLVIAERRSWVSHRCPPWGWCCWLGRRVSSLHRGRIFSKWVTLTSSLLRNLQLESVNIFHKVLKERSEGQKRNDSEETAKRGRRNEKETRYESETTSRKSRQMVPDREEVKKKQHERNLFLKSWIIFSSWRAKSFPQEFNPEKVVREEEEEEEERSDTARKKMFCESKWEWKEWTGNERVEFLFSLFLNQCRWSQVVSSTKELLKNERGKLLSREAKELGSFTFSFPVESLLFHLLFLSVESGGILICPFDHWLTEFSSSEPER